MIILTIVGARPQIIKAAALSRVISNNFHNIEEIIVHTGQHYDKNMSDVFFTELEIPKPQINLKVGSSSHGAQTALMIEKIEKVMQEYSPDAVVVYGDTNSTLASAIAASKLHIPIVHIESGLRSFNKKMPEEINRILCDHVSTLLFSPTKSGFNNLLNEGFSKEYSNKASADHPNIYHCGDVMYDNSLYFSKLSDENSDILEKLKLRNEKFILATVHRNDNTDSKIKLTDLFSTFLEITEIHQLKIILPLHPRTSKMMEQLLDSILLKKIQESNLLTIINPAGFLDMIALEKNAELIITDSGGVQKEAYFFKKPCIILRPQTEWVEIVETKSAVISDTNSKIILEATERFLSNPDLEFPEVFGNGNAASFIAQEMLNQFS
ncbi:MAG: UDP-N-acetylglucosamine 2-epimerase (non-hydrolyzing) [Flavobacteriales bacterium]|nr:UDP-N-acetylglucosamine 2-epimerase (non-hydrolyzing) [Flavobacteriales bacterium]MBL6869267.1 UDP-N-acetylglucosamine 2-epimerase (non-hydrolyzing) [Flavobacteriales bacterium]